MMSHPGNSVTIPGQERLATHLFSSYGRRDQGRLYQKPPPRAHQGDCTRDGLRNKVEIAWTTVTAETRAGIKDKIADGEARHWEQGSLSDFRDDE